MLATCRSWASIIALAASFSTATPQGASIKASQPTHYFYTPTASVNPPFNLVLSLHEVSISLPARLQLQASLFDNVGRVDFGAKFGAIRDRLAIGAGVAYNLVHVGKGGHGIMDHPRFGAYVTGCPLKTNGFEFALTGHTQLGFHNSIGLDVSLMGTPSDFWSAIGEVGTSIDLTDEAHDAVLYMNFDGGVRIHPPAIPFMNFDLGVDVEEWAVEYWRPTVTAFFDVIFAMALK